MLSIGGYAIFKFGCPNYMHPKLIKQCPHCFRIVPHTEYITISREHVQIFVNGMGSKRRSFKIVSHKDLLTINHNESMFFGSKIGQTNHKRLRTRDFLRFVARNCG